MLRVPPQFPFASDDLPPPLLLRPYQEEALGAIKAAEAQGVKRQLLVLPTGAGKTVVFSELVRRRAQRTLILAHRDELIEQAVAKLVAVLPRDVSVGVVKADRNETTADVLVGSIQTVSRERRLAQMPTDLGLVVVDEAHHAVAESYLRVLDALGCLGEHGPLLLGVTATPDRGDGQRIGRRLFEAPVYQKAMLDLVKEGYLCPVKNHHVYLDIDFGSIRTNHGDFDQDDLEQKLHKADAVHKVIEAYLTYGGGRKTLCFTPGVALAHGMAAAAREAGIAAEALDGTTPTPERRAVLRRFTAGQTMFLANCGVLTEGFDEPSVSCLVMCRPTKSRPLFVQMLGRGMRIFPGKDDVLALDVTGISSQHNVLTVPDVFIEEAEDDEDAAQTAGGAGDADEETGSRPPQLHALTASAMRAVDVDLFTAQAVVPRLEDLHLVEVRTATATYLALPLGEGLLKVGPDARGTWCVVYNAPGAAPRVLHRSGSDHDALVFTYTYAYQFGQPWAYKERLRWRGKPASERVRSYAARRGVALPERCSAGLASDLILIHHATRGFA